MHGTVTVMDAEAAGESARAFTGHGFLLLAHREQAKTDPIV